MSCTTKEVMTKTFYSKPKPHDSANNNSKCQILCHTLMTQTQTHIHVQHTSFHHLNAKTFLLYIFVYIIHVNCIYTYIFHLTPLKISMQKLLCTHLLKYVTEGKTYQYANHQSAKMKQICAARFKKRKSSRPITPPPV